MVTLNVVLAHQIVKVVVAVLENAFGEVNLTVISSQLLTVQVALVNDQVQILYSHPQEMLISDQVPTQETVAVAV